MSMNTSAALAAPFDGTFHLRACFAGGRTKNGLLLVLLFACGDTPIGTVCTISTHVRWRENVLAETHLVRVVSM